MTQVQVGDEIIFRGPQVDSKLYDGPLWPFLRDRMISYGNRVALIDPYKGEELTYLEVVSMVERLGRGLVKLGLRQGTSLCVFAPNSVQSAVLIVAIHSIGALVQASNHASMPAELRRHLDLSDAKIIVTVSELLPTVTKATQGMDPLIITIGPRDGHMNYLDLLALGSEDVPLPPPRSDPKNAVISLLFSSGTTGLPKAVEKTERNVMAWIYCLSTLDGTGMIGPEDTVLLHLPLFHVYGQLAIMVAGLALGSRLVVMTKFELVPFFTFIARYKVTALFTVPPIVISMLNHPQLPTGDDLSSLRFVFCGAAPLGKETHEQFVKKLGRPCLQGYGMTENMVSTFSSLSENKVGSAGLPLPGMEFKIVDPETGKSLGANQTGELYMRGPITMRGYHKNPEATQLTIDSRGWLHTGDVARFDSDGYLYIVDRLKELIKYKGEQVPPAVPEDVLLSHPEVSDACVIGKPDPLAGELPRAYVVRAPGSRVTEQQIMDFVAKNVPSYMQLRGGVEFRDHIPRGPSGKILRRFLRDELRSSTKSRL